MQLTAGSLLQGGKYLINHPLETQGFGVTYRGTQTYHGQPVVLKTLHPALHKSRAYARLRDRFIDIACILTRCQHPSIVRVIELFQEGDLPFVVMEYVPGQKFTELVNPGQGMAEMEALHYIRLIGAALTISHRFGLIHGNLKPQNLIRRAGSNVPVLVGYGISAERMLAAVQYAVPGFPHEFNAPEQIGEKGDRLASADIYGLAGILYYLLTGHPPLGAKDRQNKDLVDQLPLISLISPGLQSTIVEGLSLNPKQRPKTIDEWLNHLPGTNNARNVAARPEILPSIERSVRPLPPPNPNQPLTAPTQIEASLTAPTQIEAPPETPQIAATETVAALPEAPPVDRPVVDRPTFRQEPLAPSTIPPQPPEVRPRFRQDPLPSAPLPSSTAEAPVPLVPMAPSLATQQVEQQLRQRPVSPYPSLPQSPPNRIWTKMLALTAGIAATIGISFGLALRFSAARSPQGGSIFHADQSFPDRDWKGTIAPGQTEDALIEDTIANPKLDAPSKGSESNPAKTDSPFSPEPMIEAPNPITPKTKRSTIEDIPAPYKRDDAALPPSDLRSSESPAIDPAPPLKTPPPEPETVPIPAVPPAETVVPTEPAPPANSKSSGATKSNGTSNP